MKKVFLINTNTEKAPYPVPPLGLCLIASNLEDKYTVKIYDGVFDEGKHLVSELLDFNPDYIGFSIRNIDDIVADRQIFYVNKIISDFIEPVKKITSVPIIIGGSGFSIFPDELMASTGADYGIMGEAEESFLYILDCLDRGEEVSNIANIIVAKSQKSESNFQYVKRDVAKLRFSEIDRHIDFRPYMQRGAYSIQTKRGCSHGCIYCTYPVLEGVRFRRRFPMEIADEIEAVHKRLGEIMFEFVDSTFNDPAGHAEAICKEIIRRKMKIRLRTMGINPRHTSEKLFNLMRDAGFTQIDATPDSASPEVLERLDKGFKLQDIEKMALLIRQFDLPTMWFFLFGGPGEDEQTFCETMDFIDKYVNPDDLVYMAAGLRIYPKTPLYKIAVEEGNIHPGQSVFYPSVYYFSKTMEKPRIDHLIKEASKTRPNCIPAIETSPPPEMMKEAIELRSENNLVEPMFRTMLRIRREWMKKGKL
jgi:radical SAM superfamily enzyme YgiQ (UPF0313 family)